MEPDRLGIFSQLEQIQSKYVGTGHSDTTKHEWMVNIHRDTLSSCIAHEPLLNFIGFAENKPLGRVKFELSQKMVQPCGSKPDDSDM